MPLVPLYAVGLWLKRRFAGEPKRLRWPVVSVGSLSTGGAGKTPVVSALAELLERHGVAVDVLSRGYGRGSGAVERVDPEGTAARFGDEPLVLARTGLQVWVGADRYAAGVLAELEEPTSQERVVGHPAPSYPSQVREGWGTRSLAVEQRVHLLDDGFQHRRLARSLDVVLLTREDVADWLLPTGNLREPLGRLRGAGAVVLREEEAPELRDAVARLAPGVPVWVVRRLLSLSVEAERLVAFCGIARPESFFAMLPVPPVAKLAFPDHHVYTERDVDRLLRIARQAKGEGFVTTEKDAVKLTASMRGRFGKVCVAGLRVVILDEAAVMDQILAVVGHSV